MTINASVYNVQFESPTAGACSSAGRCGTPPKPRADERAERLMAALDTDGDGAVTKDEFTTGAQALLRQAGARRRAAGQDGDGDGDGEGRGLGRLERKLERLFDRVDANDDGAVDADELKTALAGVRRGVRGHGPREEATPLAEPAPVVEQHPPTEPQPASPAAPSSPAAVASTFSLQITVVTVAIQRYTAAQADENQTADENQKTAPPAHPLPPTEADAAPHAEPSTSQPLHA